MAKYALSIRIKCSEICAARGCNSMSCGLRYSVKRRTALKKIARKNPDAGDIWLWVAVDADTKLVPSWRLGQRDLATAKDFVNDLARRVKGKVQITTDALRTYVNVIEDAFGTGVDYAQLHKVYRAPFENETRYSPAKCIGCNMKAVSGNPDF